MICWWDQIKKLISSHLHVIGFYFSSEVAKKVNRDSYGLIFGVTTFLALVLQSGLTFAVNKVLQLPIRIQVFQINFLLYFYFFSNRMILALNQMISI